MLPGLKVIAPTIAASVVDTARVEGLAARLVDLGARARCLYQGKSEEELADVAPYLVPVPPDSDASTLVFEELWGRSAAIHAVTDLSLTDLRSHLRKFLMVVTEDGKTLYFRFYDPRVLRVFLPTCTPEQLAEFFGPVSAYYCEDEDPGRALKFSLAGGALQIETIDLSIDPNKKPALKIDWKGRH